MGGGLLQARHLDFGPRGIGRITFIGSAFPFQGSKVSAIVFSLNRETFCAVLPSKKGWARERLK
jgi:hypothetical protein